MKLTSMIVSTLLAATTASAGGIVVVNQHPVKPSQALTEPTTYIAYIGTLAYIDLYACAYEQIGGTVYAVPGLSMVLSTSALANSGGHMHGGLVRPNGILSRYTGVTDITGCVKSTFFSDVYTADYIVKAVATAQDGTSWGTDFAEVITQNITGFTRISAPATVLEASQAVLHSDPFYVTNQTLKVLKYIGTAFSNTGHLGSTVHVLRASMKFGGWVDAITCLTDFPSVCPFDNSEGKDFDISRATSFLNPDDKRLMSIILNIPPEINYCYLTIGGTGTTAVPPNVWHVSCVE